MAHFIKDFSFVLSGPACPVAADDFMHEIRTSPIDKYAWEFAVWYLESYGKHPEEGWWRLGWQDYPESHHVN